MDKPFELTDMLVPGFSGVAIRNRGYDNYSHYQLYVVEYAGHPVVLMFTPAEFTKCLTKLKPGKLDPGMVNRIELTGRSYHGVVKIRNEHHAFRATSSIFKSRISYRWLHLEPIDWVMLTNCEEHNDSDVGEPGNFICTKVSMDTGKTNKIYFKHAFSKQVHYGDLRDATCEVYTKIITSNNESNTKVSNMVGALLDRLTKKLLSYVGCFTPLQPTEELQLSTVPLAEQCFRLKALS